MRPSGALGKPIADLGDYRADPVARSCSDPPAGPGAIPPSAPARRGIILGLALLAALAVGALAGEALTREQVTPSTMPATEAMPASVPGFAEMFIANWLTGGDVEPFLTVELDRSPVAPRQHYVTRTATVGVRSLAPSIWVVTVAAEVLESSGEAYVDAGREYFVVTVATADGRATVVGLPARLPEVAAMSAPPTVAPFLDPAGPDELATAAGFLTAYLTGAGELGRFIHPAVEIPRFETPPYTALTILDAGARNHPGGTRLRLRIVATTPLGGTQLLEYIVEMSERDGVWFVLGIDPVVMSAGTR